MKYFLPLLVLVSCVTGCATHNTMREPMTLSRSGLINDPAQVSELEKALTDKDIAGMLDAAVRAKLPTALAVAGIHGGGYRYCDLKTISAEELGQWESLVRNIGGITGVQPVSALALGDGKATLHGFRAAAAKMNCELLLVYLESDECVSNYNDLAALYWTFVGLWLAPGNDYEHRTVIQAIVVDTRTGSILGTATGDCHAKRTAPVAFREVQQNKLRQEVPQKATADLRKACAKVLASIAESAGK